MTPGAAVVRARLPGPDTLTRRQPAWWHLCRCTRDGAASTGRKGWAELSASLFNDVRRDDARPARFDEPTFRFLNRRSGAKWQRVRDLLDEWFGRIPDEAAA